MSEYLQPTPISKVFEYLRLKAEAGLEFDFEDAVVSYLNDVLNGDTKRQADYARIWKRSESWVSRNIAKIKEEAEHHRTFYRADTQGSRKSVQDDERCTQDAPPQTPAQTPISYDDCKAAQDECKELQGGCKTYISESLDQEIEDTGSSSSSPRAREEVFGFLSEGEWGRYGAPIFEAYTKYLGFQDRYFYRVFGDSRDSVGRDLMVSLISRHGWPMVCAALTITAMSKNGRERSLNYAVGIIGNWQEDQHGRSRRAPGEPGRGGAGVVGDLSGDGFSGGSEGGIVRRLPARAGAYAQIAGKKPGELSIRENLLRSGYTEEEAQRIVDGRGIFGDANGGDDAQPNIHYLPPPEASGYG